MHRIVTIAMLALAAGCQQAEPDTAPGEAPNGAQATGAVAPATSSAEAAAATEQQENATNATNVTNAAQ